MLHSRQGRFSKESTYFKLTNHYFKIITQRCTKLATNLTTRLTKYSHIRLLSSHCTKLTSPPNAILSLYSCTKLVKSRWIMSAQYPRISISDHKVRRQKLRHLPRGPSLYGVARDCSLWDLRNYAIDAQTTKSEELSTRPPLSRFYNRDLYRMLEYVSAHNYLCQLFIARSSQTTPPSITPHLMEGSQV